MRQQLQSLEDKKVSHEGADVTRKTLMERMPRGGAWEKVKIEEETETVSQ